MCERDGPTLLTRRATLALAAGGLAALATGCGRPVDDADLHTAQDADQDADVPPGASPVPVFPGLAIWPRAAWGADLPPRARLVPEDVRFLLVHHGAIPNDYSQAQVRTLIRSVYAFHTGPAKGWPDVCYNFFIDRFGGVWEARAGSLAGPVQASATGGSQGFAQLVCLLGDYTSVLPSSAALGALTNLLAWLGGHYALDTRQGARTSFVSRGSQRWPAGTTVTTGTIAGHRDMSYTGCPGDRLYPLVRDQLAGWVTETRRRVAASTAPGPGPYQKAVRVNGAVP